MQFAKLQASTSQNKTVYFKYEHYTLHSPQLITFKTELLHLRELYQGFKA